jgi:serine/threonine protein kinase
MTPVARTVGDYELVSEVGDRGGMAVVYVAKHVRMGRRVALKQVDLRGERSRSRAWKQGRSQDRLEPAATAGF